MPEIRSKTIFSFSSEDPQFPAQNLLETRITKKWKCREAGERNCFVVLKLDQPRVISGIDIGNERSGFIEVFVANSKQDPPDFKEILLATSFMTIIEAKNGNNPTRVRCFANNALVESVAKQQWDLVKVFCTQPFNNRIQYGLSFITLHTPEVIADDNSPVKTIKQTVNLPIKAGGSDEKKMKFGKFTMRENSDSDPDSKKESPFNRWKSQSTKSDQQSTKMSIKEQVKAKLDESRKRIKLMSDSSDDEKPKAKVKPSRNRTTGLVYEDEDDAPNEKLQKKLDKDKERKEKDHKTPKILMTRREKSPTRSESKFASFINDDTPSTSSSSTHDKSTPDKRKNSIPSSSSMKKSSPKHSPRHQKETKTKSAPSSSKTVTYKPFHKLLEGVVFVFSGYVNPERGILRQKATDMGAKYKPDWDNRCTHLICAFSKTPKHVQVKGKGKIVTKRWIEACFDDQKKLPWRRYALDKEDKDEPESEDEVLNELLKPNIKIVDSDSDSDMIVVDRREKNGNEKKVEEVKAMEIDDDVEEVKNITKTSQDFMDASTDDDMMEEAEKWSDHNLTQAENQVFKDKVFYLNEDLPATDVIKLKNQIAGMMGKITDKSRRADYVITDKGRRLPEPSSAEVLLSLWVYECYELGAFIPTTRYKPK